MYCRDGECLVAAGGVVLTLRLRQLVTRLVFKVSNYGGRHDSLDSLLGDMGVEKRVLSISRCAIAHIVLGGNLQKMIMSWP